MLLDSVSIAIVLTNIEQRKVHNTSVGLLHSFIHIQTTKYYEPTYVGWGRCIYIMGVREGVFSLMAVSSAYFEPSGRLSATTGENCLGFAFICCKHSLTGLNSSGRPHYTGFCNITDKTCVQWSILSSMRFPCLFLSLILCCLIILSVWDHCLCKIMCKNSRHEKSRIIS